MVGGLVGRRGGLLTVWLALSWLPVWSVDWWAGLTDGFLLVILWSAGRTADGFLAGRRFGFAAWWTFGVMAYDLSYRAFMTSSADPQKKHFSDHLSDSLHKDRHISLFQGFYHLECPPRRFGCFAKVDS